ncbi:hypothetical protein [Oceanospirillum linum]|uniref:Zinc/iron-chelating domain-containing protein n=1 Tax=Oceanospirillum linum TaxID=966 RepID=A0A1T1HC84_OCELI|nr:hypothetical protein [Oceanospirillum linum]OOV87488.1 hypothetical protein BTA35_0205450 [Oceanospirillum linum]SEF89589.1 hypothetical protein SAMN04489856_10357 [Oleiphilus messinensis]SMP13617.1 hypothetical protein SAMN06264348_102483 [Oceanospirillum linum]
MALTCRMGCAACYTAPSISSPLPKMPTGKPAGVPCAHLLSDLKCELFGRPERPKVCGDFQPADYVCGDSREQALILLTELERCT